MEREAILSRQYRTAIHGENAESIRAADLIAKVCKWYQLAFPALCASVRLSDDAKLIAAV